MKINPLYSSEHTQNVRSKSLKTKPMDKDKDTAPHIKNRKDVYLPQSNNQRQIDIEKIKQKIKQGYYNSDEVTEDLSDSFAKAFDKTFDQE